MSIATHDAAGADLDVIDAGESERFLSTLFDGADGYVPIHHADPAKAYRNTKGVLVTPLQTDWFKASESERAAARAAQLARRFCVWFGVGLRARPIPGNKRGGTEDVTLIGGLWSDIDYAHAVHKKAEALPRTFDEAMAVVRAFPLAPTFVIHSGHGLQPWWLFRYPWALRTPEERDRAQALSNRFKATIRAAAKRMQFKVDAVADLARVMRLPGTLNRKDPSAVVPVTIIEEAAHLRYEPEDFEPHLLAEDAEDEGDVEPEFARGVDGPGAGGQYAPATTGGDDDDAPRPLTDDELIRKACDSRSEFGKLWRGDTSGHGKDASAADLALCNHLRFWTNRDRARVDTLFRRSGLMRPKWDEKHAADGSTYGDMTLDLAMAGGNGDGYTGKVRPKTNGGAGNRNGNPGGDGAPDPDGDRPPEPYRWPVPIPLDTPTAPSLPPGIFTGWLGDMIEATAEATETPMELAAAFGLAAVSAAVARRFSVLIRPGYFEPIHVWPLCSMESGNRKTANMLAMVEPLAAWERQRAAELLPEIERARSERKTMEARVAKLRTDASKAKVEDFARMKKELADLEASLPEVPTLPQLFAQDVTTEHTGTMLADNGERLALISDEGGVFDIMAGRYSNGVPNLDVYLQGHAGAFVRVNRGSRPAVNLQHPALTIGVSPQPDVLRGLTSNRGFRGRGLLARFLYLIPPSRLGFRRNDGRPVPDDVKTAYRDAVMRLADVAPARDGDNEVPHVLRLSPDALALWERFWAENELAMRPGARLEHMKDWAGKLPGAVARLAGLLHVADYASSPTEAKQIQGETMERAVMLGQLLTGHGLIAFDLMGADDAMDAARVLWATVEKLRKPQFSARDAWHPNRGRYHRMSDVEGGFDVLIDHGYIAEPHQGEDDMPRKRGRPPSRVFEVNPVLMEGWEPD